MPIRHALLLLVTLALVAERSHAQTLAHLQGEMAGEVTDTSVILQSRLTAPQFDASGDLPGRRGVARFEIAEDSGFRTSRKTDWIRAEAASDFVVKARIPGLKPHTRYFYRLVYGPDRENLSAGETRSFRTLAAATDPEPVRFVVVTGMHYARFRQSDQGKGPDSLYGYPALDAIRNLSPDFFVGTGDNVYYDHDPRAETIDALRKKWHEQFVQPAYVRLFSHTPVFWEKDDHDYRYDDADTTGNRLPGHELGLRLFLEQVPVTDPTYRTVRAGQLVQLWFLEGRDYRSPNRMPDGPEKTIWGDKQKEWLKRTLLASDAPFKLVISPTPLVGPDDARKRDNHTNPEGFMHEGTAFFAWAKENGLLDRGLYFICGDRHWQYHSIHPSGFEEFSTGALVDGNARLGRNPGDPASTDPDALIRQPFTSPEATGGFLEVVVEPGDSSGGATARFQFRDDFGRVLYSAEKTAR